MSIRDRVRQYILDNRMLEKGETVCVGLSGGADSVCLLYMLTGLSRELDIRVTAFHVNHCLRGAEGDSDQLFVRELCGRMGIPLKEFVYDISGLSKEKKKGLEETGRLMRRKAAAEAGRSFGASKTALAHHANDNAETVLFNLARGSSTGGLKGILPVNGSIIRPLLCLERCQIEQWLRDNGITWVEDATNSETDYSRNKLRNIIIPEIEDSINTRAVRHINEAAGDIAEAVKIIDALAEERLGEYSGQTEEGILLKNGIMTEYRLVNGRIALTALERTAGRSKDLERVHAGAIEELFGKQTGRRLELPYKIVAERVYDGVLIRKKKSVSTRITDEAVLPVNGTIEYNGLTISTRLLEKQDIPKKIPQKRYTKWFDYDKILRCGLLRTRRPGDFIVINAEGGRKKLKEYFIDEKVPQDERDRYVCLANGSEIIWIIGLRISESVKVTENTNTVLEVKIMKEDTDEQ